MLDVSEIKWEKTIESNQIKTTIESNQIKTTVEQNQIEKTSELNPVGNGCQNGTAYDGNGTSVRYLMQQCAGY